LETGIKVRLLLSLLKLEDAELAKLWTSVVRFLHASKNDSEPWVRAAMDIVVARLRERKFTPAVTATVDQSQLPTSSGMIESARDAVLKAMWGSWHEAWTKRRPVQPKPEKTVLAKQHEVLPEQMMNNKHNIVGDAKPAVNDADGDVKMEVDTVAVVAGAVGTGPVAGESKAAAATTTSGSETVAPVVDAAAVRASAAVPGSTSSQSSNLPQGSEPKSTDVVAAAAVTETKGQTDVEQKGDNVTVSKPNSDSTKIELLKKTASSAAVKVEATVTATDTTSTTPGPPQGDTSQQKMELTKDATAATPAPSPIHEAVKAKPVAPVEAAEEMYLVPPDFCPTEWLFMSQSLLQQQGHYDLAYSARNVHFTPLAMDKFTVELPVGNSLSPTNATATAAAAATTERLSNGTGDANKGGVGLPRTHKPPQQQRQPQQQQPKTALPSAAEIMARRMEARKNGSGTAATATTNKPILKVVDHNEMERQRLLRQAAAHGRVRAGVARGGGARGGAANKRRPGVMTRGGSASAVRGGSAGRGMHKRVRGGGGVGGVGRGGLPPHLMQRHTSAGSASLTSPGSDSGSEYYPRATHDANRTPYASSEGSYPRPTPSPSPPLGSPMMASPGWSPSPGPESPSESPPPTSPGGGTNAASVAANLLRGAKKMSVEHRRMVEAFFAGEGNPNPETGDEKRILHSQKHTKTANTDIYLQETFYVVINYQTRKYRKVKQKKHIKVKRKQPTPSPAPAN
jgi:hypothetical protein